MSTKTYIFKNKEGKELKLTQEQVDSILDSFKEVSTINIPLFESFDKDYFLENIVVKE